MAADLTSPLPARIESDAEFRRRARTRRLRLFIRSLFSHTIINLIGLFFLIPFLWMVLTAVKSSHDAVPAPPRCLPYDNVRVTVNGKELPLYNVRTESGMRQLA